jgi:cyclophilin family peptidyl-prolyl cis-trans isomerase
MSDTVVIKTSKGDITVQLDREKAPVSVDNFLKYVDAKYYDGTIFHRVIDGFMIQGGGFLPGMKSKGGTNPPIKNESPNGLSNKRGTIALARTSDPDSATCQFYINVVDNSGTLDKPRYCVFGTVTAGMDVADAIKGVATATKAGYKDVPVEDVVIQSVRRLPT